MTSRRAWFSAALILGTSLCLAKSTSAAAAPCEEGFGKGDWDLPASSGGTGWLDGTLYLTNGPTPGPVARYSITGTLTDVPTPCLSCIEGTVDAWLDDGFGPAPDYIVVGNYFGAWLTGAGDFECYIYEPWGATPVGKFVGTFEDPPGSGAIGEFKADWEICP